MLRALATQEGWESASRGARRRWIEIVAMLAPLLVLLLVFTLPNGTRLPQAARQSAAPAGGPSLAQVAPTAAPYQPGQACLPGVQVLNPERPPEQRTRIVTLVAAPLRSQIRPGVSVPAWAYNASVPAPEIRGVQGELLRVVLCNQLPAPVTIHWHGYPVPWRQDGVAGMTQDAVQPGATYVYQFRLTIPGTYWYHSHQDSAAQVDRGLYGMFVVEPAAPSADSPVTDVEQNVVLADDAGNALWVGDPDPAPAGSARQDEGVIRKIWTLNGGSYPYVPPLRVRPGQTVRLRILNVGLQTHRLKLGGHLYRLVAVDGQPVHAPQLTDATINVSSGERYDLVFTADNPGAWSLRSVDADERASQMRLRIVYPTGADTPGAADAAWHPAAQPLDLLHYGSAAGVDPGLRTAVSFTQVYTVDLVQESGAWHANIHDAKAASAAPPATGAMSHAGMAMDMAGAAPPMAMTLKPGDTVKMVIVNHTETEHPIHLHGHFFELLTRDGQPYTGAPIQRDTITVWPHQTMVVAFKADNPGVWMLHCHILWHAGMGMGFMFNYDGIETPYRHGGPAGNKSE